MMTVQEILAQLPADIAKDLQIRIEDASLGNHLTEDEAKEILDGIIHTVKASHDLSNDEVARNVDYLVGLLRDAVIGLVF